MSVQVHELKTWPGFFQSVWDGDKRAELRKDDRGFEVGDFLVLREYDPVTAEYSGRRFLAEISHIVRESQFGLAPGFAMLSLYRHRRLRPGEIIPAQYGIPEANACDA